MHVQNIQGHSVPPATDLWGEQKNMFFKKTHVQFKHSDKDLLICILFVQQGLNQFELDGVRWGYCFFRELNSGHTLLLKWTEREGRVRFGNRHADSRPLQSVERGTDRLQPAALSVPARRAPQTSAHDHHSEWCECRWCLNSSSLLQFLFISALFHSPE